MSSPKGKRSVYPRDRDNYPDDRSYRSRDDESNRPRNLPSVTTPATGSVVPYMSGYRGYGPPEAQDVSARRAAHARQAFILIGLDDFEKCARLVMQHPSVLEQDTFALQQSAIQAYRERDDDLAERLAQRVVLVKICSTIRSGQIVDYIQSLQYRGATRTEFNDTYGRVRDALKLRAFPNDGSNELVYRPSGLSPTTQVGANASSPYQRDLSRDMQNLTLQPHQSQTSIVHPSSDSTSRGPIRRYSSQGETSRATKSVRPIFEERAPNPDPDPYLTRNADGTPTATNRAKIQVRGAHTSSLDPNFWVRKHPENFFVSGKIFKVLWHQPAGSDTQGRVNPGSHTRGAFGEPIQSSLRWMMVLIPKHGYCICCPISTYSKQGSFKQGLSEEDVREHAILHAVGTDPYYAPGEYDRMTKDPIRAKLAPGVSKIDPLSRVHFGKYHTVEYNVKVMDIGWVIPDDLPKATSYFVREFSRSYA